MHPLALSVVIPAYNEARRLPVTLDAVCDYLHATAQAWEVVVADDGSTDGTVPMVSRYADAHGDVRLLQLAAHRGKGAAVAMGVLAARHPWVLLYDADGATPIATDPESEREQC